ncbi:MAG: DUF3021 family protein [Lachnospiraceae bacterium]|nr:DUF3021 family protein [Lachnospiraceae bacterium]
MVKEFFVSLLQYFLAITTGVILAAAVFFSFSDHQPDFATFWQILFYSFITALPSSLFLCLDTKSAKASLALWTFHYILIYSLTLFLLKVFKWCDITPVVALFTFLAVSFIYFFTSFSHYLSDRKHTALMNEQLKKRYNRK